MKLKTTPETSFSDCSSARIWFHFPWGYAGWHTLPCHGQGKCFGLGMGWGSGPCLPCCCWQVRRCFSEHSGEPMAGEAQRPHNFNCADLSLSFIVLVCIAKYIPGHGGKEADLLLMFKKMALENNTERWQSLMLQTWEVRGDKQAVNLLPLHLCCAIWSP